jgi:cell division protein FtsL
VNDWTPPPQRQGLSSGQKVLIVFLIVVGVVVALGFNYFAGLV